MDNRWRQMHMTSLLMRAYDDICAKTVVDSDWWPTLTLEYHNRWQNSAVIRGFQTLIWRLGGKAQYLEPPGLSGWVDSPVWQPVYYWPFMHAVIQNMLNGTLIFYEFIEILQYYLQQTTKHTRNWFILRYKAKTSWLQY